MYARRKLREKLRISNYDTLNASKSVNIVRSERNPKEIVPEERIRELNLSVLKNFLSEKTRYDPTKITFLSDLKDAYNEYLRGIDLDIKQALNALDIPKIDSRFEYKRIPVCKWCDKRHYAKCCDDYSNSAFRLRYGFKNMSLV